ncbi:MAG: hypothetical protein HY905_17905 [Deltaproteobacteria bacterium]|nr:hypothetical protein [Deltaproteobacteria bacterium]
MTNGNAVAIVVALAMSACSGGAEPTEGGGDADVVGADDGAADGDGAESAGDAEGGEDAGSGDDAEGGGEVDDDGAASCGSPADCQDGVFCNGYEACAPGTAGADARGCLAGTPPCAGACDEAALGCTPPRCDALPAACTGSADCDDGTACNGAETCDADGLCRPGTAVTCGGGARCLESLGGCSCTPAACVDDGLYCNGVERCHLGGCDGGPPPCDPSRCVEAEDACSCTDASQCDDGLYCNGLEFCNTSAARCELFAISCTPPQICLEGLNRCAAACTANSDCDDGIAATVIEVCIGGRCRIDADGDGHSSIASGGDDCDDTNRFAFPGNPELCDLGGLLDEDCNPRTFDNPFVAQDADADGFVDAGCCNIDTFGVWWCGDDCDDHRASSNPSNVEACNGYDDDCNGLVDDGVLVAQYRDRDGDGDGDPGCPAMKCPATAGWAVTGTDCDDMRATIHGGSIVCDPGGSGVRTCTGGAWAAAPCPAGTTCRPQPDGTGFCL